MNYLIINYSIWISLPIRWPTTVENGFPPTLKNEAILLENRADWLLQNTPSEIYCFKLRKHNVCCQIYWKEYFKFWSTTNFAIFSIVIKIFFSPNLIWFENKISVAYSPIIWTIWQELEQLINCWNVIIANRCTSHAPIKTNVQNALNFVMAKSIPIRRRVMRWLN